MDDEVKVKVGVEPDIGSAAKAKFEAAIQNMAKSIPPINLSFKISDDSIKAITTQFKGIESQISSQQSKFAKAVSKMNSDAAKSINNSNLTKQNSTWLARQEKALEKVNLGANSTPAISGKESQLAKINQEYSKTISLIDQLKSSTSALSAVQMAQVENAVSGIQKQFKSYQDLGQMSDKQAKKLVEEFDTGRLGNSLTKISGQSDALGLSAASGATDSLAKLKAQYSEIAIFRKKMQESGAGEDAGMQQDLAKQISLYKELAKSVQSYVDIDKAKKRDADTTQVEVGRLQKLSNELRNYLEINDRALTNPGIKNSSTDLLSEINGLAAVEKIAATQTDALSGKFATLKGHVKDLGLEGQTLGTKLTAQMSKLGIYFSAATVMMGAWNQVKNTIGNVTELDKAVTDLQIATGKTRDETKELLNTYSDMGKQLGGTTAQVAEAGDDWLRQNKSIETTNKLIKDSLMLSKLGKISSSEATSALTAMSKAYKVPDEGMTSIVDMLTAVDMVSATTAGGLAKSFQETAVSADLAGISMERMSGYIATVSEISQDAPESVGNFFKSFLSRMSNIKEGRMVDENTGEDLSTVETVLHNIGINLRDDNDQFRNFGTVLDETAVKWKEMGEVGDKVGQSKIASALGLTRQQEKAKILFENYDTALNYADVAANSLGTAEQKFNDAYLASTEASMNNFTAQYEQISNTIWNSELIKGTFDAGTGLLGGLNEIVGVLGALPPLLTAAAGAASLFTNKGIFSLKDDATKAGGKALDYPLFGLKNAYLQGKEGKQDSVVFQRIAKDMLTSTDASATFKKSMDSLSATGKETGKSIINAGKDIKDSGEQSSKAAEGFNKAAVSAQKLGVASKAVGVLKTVGTMALNMAAGFVVGFALDAAIKGIDYLINYSQKLQEAADEAKSKISEINSEYESKADAVEKDAAAYEKLAKGVDSLTGKNINLSSEDYKEFLSISNELATLFPDLVVGYDSQGNALLNLSDNAKTVTDSLEQLLKAERALADEKILEGSDKIWENTNAKMDKINAKKAVLESGALDKEFFDAMTRSNNVGDQDHTTDLQEASLRLYDAAYAILSEQFDGDVNRLNEANVAQAIQDVISDMVGTDYTGRNYLGHPEFSKEFLKGTDFSKFFNEGNIANVVAKNNQEAAREYSNLLPTLMSTLRSEFQIQLDGMSDQQQANKTD